MGGFQNVMQVFTLLDKSNCRKCGEKTCLAFASAVFKGEKDLSACPALSEELVSQYSIRGAERYSTEDTAGQLDGLIEKVRALDLGETAVRVG